MFVTVTYGCGPGRRSGLARPVLGSDVTMPGSVTVASPSPPGSCLSLVPTGEAVPAPGATWGAVTHAGVFEPQEVAVSGAELVCYPAHHYLAMFFAAVAQQQGRATSCTVTLVPSPGAASVRVQSVASAEPTPGWKVVGGYGDATVHLTVQVDPLAEADTLPPLPLWVQVHVVPADGDPGLAGAVIVPSDDAAQAQAGIQAATAGPVPLAPCVRALGGLGARAVTVNLAASRHALPSGGFLASSPSTVCVGGTSKFSTATAVNRAAAKPPAYPGGAWTVGNVDLLPGQATPPQPPLVAAVVPPGGMSILGLQVYDRRVFAMAVALNTGYEPSARGLFLAVTLCNWADSTSEERLAASVRFFLGLLDDAPPFAAGDVFWVTLDTGGDGSNAGGNVTRCRLTSPRSSEDGTTTCIVGTSAPIDSLADGDGYVTVALKDGRDFADSYVPVTALAVKTPFGASSTPPGLVPGLTALSDTAEPSWCYLPDPGWGWSMFVGTDPTDASANVVRTRDSSGTCPWLYTNACRGAFQIDRDAEPGGTQPLLARLPSFDVQTAWLP
jgi:hypothetical protein